MATAWRGRIGAAILAGFAVQGFVLTAVAVGISWHPLTPVWGRVVGLAFPPVATLAFAVYLWWYRDHEYRSLLYTYAGLGCLVGAPVFLTPGVGMVAQQTLIGRPVLNVEIFFSESWLGGGLVGLTTGHFYAQIRGERVQLERLHGATQELILATDTAEVAERTVTEGERILGLDTSAMYVPRDETTLEPIAATERTADVFGEVPTIDSRDAIAWSVYESGDPHFVDNVRDHPDVYNPETPVRSEMIIPVEDTGVFMAASTDVGAFDESDRMLARVLLSNAEAAFRRASQEERLRERERKLEGLQERSERLMYTQTREETARVAVEAARDVIGAPLAGIHLLDESGDALEDAAMTEAASERFGDTLSYRRDHEDGSSDALVWDVFERGESLYVEDTREYDPLTEEPPSRSVLLYPVADHGVFIASGERPRGFDEVDRTLFEVLTSVLENALDRVEREHTLRRSESRLEQHRQRLTVLNRVLRHDIRNNANVILGALTEVTRTLGDEPALDKIRRKTDKIVELGENARRVERTIGNMDGATETVDVTGVVDSTVEDLRQGWPDVETRTDMPDQAHAASNGLIDAAVENVLVNAVEHNDSTPAEIDVSVSRDPDDEEVLIRIADNGPGIPAPEREVFEQRDETKLQHSSGLGLWLVYWIVEDVDGTVQIEEREPRGTAVTLRLPRVTVPDISHLA